MPLLTLDGIRFHYQQAGQGRDVMLMHAVTSNLAVWTFTNLIGTLAADFRVTAYDLRGHGYSEVTPTGYTSADMAEDFRRLHDALHLGPTLLVGHSFGGVVALHAASLYSERVAGVIISDTFVPGLAYLESEPGSWNVWRDLRRAFGQAGVDLGEAVDFTRLFHAVADLTPEQMAVIQGEMGAPSVRWLAGLPRLAETTCGADVFAVAGLTAERIASVRQPVVALYDQYTPFQATCRYLAEHLPDCTVETVPGARHIAPLQNTPAFVQLVQQHLHRLAGTRTCASRPS